MEKSSLPSNFDLEIKDVSDATTLVVEETESEKEFSLEAKSIIEFVDNMPQDVLSRSISKRPTTLLDGDAS